MLLAPRSMLLPLLLTLCALFLAPVARGQNLSGTDYGKSQNTAQDLANSLTPGKERVGKGEKKSEVDPKSLPSKKAAKDPLFQGGLADIGVDWNGDKIGKPRGSQGANSTAGGREASANRSREAGDSVSGEPSGANADSKTSKPADAAAEKDSKTSKQTDASADKTAANIEKKEQKAEPSKSDDKPADKEKAANKSDGDH